jgi:hypothetical protein
MQRTMGWGRVAVGVAGLGITASLIVWGQFGQTNGSVALQQRTEVLRQEDASGSASPADLAWNEKRMRALNEDRHKSMVSDAEKLLKLARQLDAEVASNPTDEMTPAELRKVTEIEKLAKSVKSKMALSFSGGPQLQPPILPQGIDGPVVR